MVRKFEAGIAFVKVVPSMRHFHRDIGRKLKGLDAEAQVPVGAEADTPRVQAAVRQVANTARTRRAQVPVEVDASSAAGSAKKAAKSAQDAMAEAMRDTRLRAQAVDILSGVREQMGRRQTTTVSAHVDAAKARAEIEALREITPQLRTEVTPEEGRAQVALSRAMVRRAQRRAESEAIVRQAQARMDETRTQGRARELAVQADMGPVRQQINQLLQRRKTGVDVSAEMAVAEAKLTKLQQQQRTIQVQVDADVKRAQATIEAAKARWEHDRILLDADVEGAREKLREIREDVDTTDGRKARVRADVEGAERAVTLLSLITAGLSAVGAAGPAAAAGLAGVPVVVAGIGQAVGVGLAGFSGISDALKELDESQNTAGKSAAAMRTQMAQLDAAMANLAPAGRAFAYFLHDELLPAMDDVRFGVQQALLPGIQGALGQLVRAAPAIRESLASTGSVFGDLAERGAGMVTSPAWMQDMRLVTAGNNRAFADLGNAGMAGMDAIRSLMAAATPMVERVAETIETAALRFNEFIQSARASGQLQVWFGQAADALETLGGVVKETAVGLWNLVSALAPVGMGLLQVVGNAVSAVGTFTQAHPALAQLAASALLAAGAFVALGRGVGGLIGAFGSAYDGFTRYRDTITGIRERAATAGTAVGNLATNLSGNATAGEKVGRSVGGVLSAVGRLAGYIPIAGAVIGGLALVFDGLSTSASEAADALLRGGASAQQAMAQVRDQNKFTGWGWLDAFGGPGQMLKSVVAPSEQDVRAEANQKLAQMPRLERAQTLQTQARADYDLAVEQQGPGSEAATAAQQRLAAATAEVEAAQRAAAEATKSHTDRLIEQQQQAMSMLDKDLALRMALTQVEQAQRSAAQATAQYGAGSLQATSANQQLEQQMLRAAQAAQAKAQAQYAGTSADTRAQFATAAYNQTLANLVVQAGAQAPLALRQYLAGLDSSALGAIHARMETDSFGNAVLVLPGEKRVFLGVQGDADAIARINNLRAAIASMPSQHWFTVYTRQIVDAVQPPKPNPNAPPLPLVHQAVGGVVRPFAAGGIAGLTPMRPVAQVVPPNTWRLVGDRMSGDEAYIPLNGSGRSRAILREAANRMGFTVIPRDQQARGMAAGGVLAARPYTTTPRPGPALPADRDQISGTTTYAPQITVNARTDASPEHIAAAVDRRLRIRSRL